MTSDDLLDVAEAALLEPLRKHPEELAKFRETHLYAPLPGTKQSKKAAKANALAAMGIDPKNVKAGVGAGRKKGKLAAKKARERKEREGTGGSSKG